MVQVVPGHMDFDTLLHRCRKLDRYAFNEFCRRYYSLAFTIASKKGIASQEIEDLIQDIFLRFFQKNLFKKFRGQTEIQFKAYLIQITVNTAINWHRTETRREDKVCYVDLANADQISLFSIKSNPHQI